MHQRDVEVVPGGQRLVSVVALNSHRDDGGVRGIATGLAFRRLVAECLARQLARRWKLTDFR